jgi:hypothetical protein
VGLGRDLVSAAQVELESVVGSRNFKDVIGLARVSVQGCQIVHCPTCFILVNAGKLLAEDSRN